jgi:hypothetical protein
MIFFAAPARPMAPCLLSAPGGGDGRGEVGATSRPAAYQRTLPPHPAPLPAQGRAERERFATAGNP